MRKLKVPIGSVTRNPNKIFEANEKDFRAF
jgi:hypothetical protein